MKHSLSRYSPELHEATREDIFYALTMFPYPSGYGLHVGHASVFTINDVVARFRRLQGKTVFNPIGFDSFGLPTENYAMKLEKPAYEVTQENIAMFLKQIDALKMSFDMDRVLATSTPEYYKRTQRLFQELYKAGLVYRDELRVNWCPECQTVLANDQVVDGACERCKSEIIQKKMPQWFIKITEYADRLLADLATIDRPEETKIGQRNWIGRSEGALISFEMRHQKTENTLLEVFTTRPDTLFGVTALVVAPENTILDDLIPAEQKEEVLAYRKETMSKTAVQRQQDTKEKTGVFSGVYGIHPLTGEELPVWYADYVLPDYATGSVMLVPGHDQRDKEFAEKFQIPVVQVLEPVIGENTHPEEVISKVGGYAFVRNKQGHFLIMHATKAEVPGVAGGSKYFLPGGGLDAGEDLFEGTVRELQEETGYTHFKQLGKPVQIKNYYYSQRKQLHRENNARYFLLELEDETRGQQQLDPYEAEIGFEVERMSEEQVEHLERHPRFKKAFEIVVKGEVIREGTLINSGAFDGLDYKEAQQKIVATLETQGKGKKKTTYRLRDRSVSRQRYRGSPIPVYYVPKENPKVPFRQRDGIRKVHQDKPMTARKTISALLYNPQNESYALIRRLGLEVENYTFVLGGVDEGESFEDAAYREIREETGYTNILLKNHLGHFQTEFRHAVKERNQHNITECFLFELLDETNDGHAQESHENLEVVRMTKEQILNQIPAEPLRDYFLHLAAGDDIVWEGDRTEKRNERNVAPPSACVPELIPQDELPVVLPLDVENYKPKGKSPLEDHPTFPVYTAKDGKKYRRECDTLDTFMCSSFYFLRYPDAHNEDELCDPTLLNKMFPIELYTGGKEHTVGHLLYARFIYKFLYDQGYVASPEPFAKLVHQGMVLGGDGRKMSKRRGNVIDPLDVIDQYGVDAVRMYLMFMGPVDQDKIRNDNALKGVAKFLQRVKKLQPPTGVSFRADESYLTAGGGEQENRKATVLSLYHKTVKALTDDMVKMKFNTAVSKLMILINGIFDQGVAPREVLEGLPVLLAPFAPEISEVFWTSLGCLGDVHFASRPVADEYKIAQEMIDLPVQVNGKMRGNIALEPGMSEEDVLERAQQVENVNKYIAGKPVKKVIYVQDKIINIIV